MLLHALRHWLAAGHTAMAPHACRIAVSGNEPAPPAGLPTHSLIASLAREWKSRSCSLGASVFGDVCAPPKELA
jgi:hypothetical protein